jgi:pilus assembly protein CpaB
MRSRTLILIILAVVLAGGTALLARSWLASERNREIASASPVPVPTPSKSVLVARSDLKRGQLLKAEDLVWQVWPEGGLSSNYIVIGTKTPESFAGWVVREPIVAGEPITEKKVVAPGNRGFLAAVLRPGMRAVSVPVTPTTGGTGFIFPGDQVDVMITYSVTVVDPDKPNQNAQNNEHKVAETVLRDIRVIAIDTKTDSKPGDAVVAAHTATLEVTPKQSEVLTLSNEMGKLSLTLRSIVPSSTVVAAATPGPDYYTKVAAGDTGATDTNPPVAEANPAAPDSPGAIDATYTLDSEISSLLRPLTPQGQEKKAKKNGDIITILRGGGKGSESINPDAGSKGS